MKSSKRNMSGIIKVAIVEMQIMVLQLTEGTFTFEKMIVCEQYTHIRKVTNDSSLVSHHLQCHIL